MVKAIGIGRMILGQRASLSESFALAQRLGPAAATRHYFTNIVTGRIPSGVIGRAAVLYVEGQSVRGSGLYEDDLVQEQGLWLFARRVVTHGGLRPPELRPEGSPTSA